jgi:hypothetical protein
VSGSPGGGPRHDPQITLEVVRGNGVATVACRLDGEWLMTITARTPFDAVVAVVEYVRRTQDRSP